MVNSFETFRIHYPKGALIADLVSVHEGQYVVRAAVMHEGETLATGLAASADIQVAEDRARERAIALLAIPSETPKNGAAANRKAAESNQRLAVQLPAEALTPDYVEPSVALEEALEEPSLPMDEEDLGPPIDAIEDRPEEKLSDEPVEESAVMTPARASAAAIALENFTSSANPVDLSDVIAQTDVELTRLGWTSAQGREYLEKTYGKRSRQQLTDEELMSFLLHLEEQ